MVNGKLKHTRAFPVGVKLPEDRREDSDAFMKAHLTEDTFKGEMMELFEELVKTLGQVRTGSLSGSDTAGSVARRPSIS